MSKYKISEHKDEIKTNIISNIVWYVITFILGNIVLWIPLIRGVYKAIEDNTYKIPTYAFILASISILLSIVIIILIIFVIKKFKKDEDINSDDNICIDNNNSNIDKNETHSYSDLSLEYKFKSITAEMTFDDNRMDIKSTIDYKMEVLADEVTELKRQLIWSGSNYNGTELLERNGNYTLDDSHRTSSPYSYTIKFNENKKRGDIIQFKTETSVRDGNLSMLPVYSFMVKYQIDVLILRVIAPKNMIKNVKKVVYADSAREICVQEPKDICGEPVRDLMRYTFEIQNPNLLYNYFIEWEFTNN